MNTEKVYLILGLGIYCILRGMGPNQNLHFPVLLDVLWNSKLPTPSKSTAPNINNETAAFG